MPWSGRAYPIRRRFLPSGARARASEGTGGRPPRRRQRVSARFPARSIWDMSSPLPTREQVLTALAGVNDPEIGRPITDLGMVKSVEIRDDGLVAVGVYLTVSGG